MKAVADASDNDDCHFNLQSGTAKTVTVYVSERSSRATQAFTIVQGNNTDDGSGFASEHESINPSATGRAAVAQQHCSSDATRRCNADNSALPYRQMSSGWLSLLLVVITGTATILVLG